MLQFASWSCVVLFGWHQPAFTSSITASDASIAHHRLRCARHGRNHSRSTEPSLLSDGIGRYLGIGRGAVTVLGETPWPGLVAHQRHTCLPSACEYAVTETRMPYSPPALPMNTMRFQACGAIVSLNPAFGSPTVVCHTTSPVRRRARTAIRRAWPRILPSSTTTPVVGPQQKGGEAELRRNFHFAVPVRASSASPCH